LSKSENDFSVKTLVDEPKAPMTSNSMIQIIPAVTTG
jgi:hypothetical protein